MTLTTSTCENLPPLQWQDIPLQGRVLIEASAGTGKTWNIGLIHLRLLLECGLPVEQILVTTFTDAAAQELRERLRRRLLEAERWLDGSARKSAAADDNPLEAWLEGKFSSAEDVALALRRTRIARVDFDRAPIDTIHSLCQRIRRDFPLESGAAFAADKLIDEKALLRECVEDFWRRRYLAGTVDAREAAAVLPAGPEGLLRDLGALLARQARAIPADGQEQLARQTGELRNAGNIAELRRLVEAAKLFKRSNSALRTRLTKIADALDAGADIEVLEKLVDANFDPEKIQAQQPANAPQDLRDHPLIRSLQQLRGLLDGHGNFARGAVLAAALDYCRREMPRRARTRDAQTFSMLIDNVHARLIGDRADSGLAESLFKAFPAALIDEFQDTDQRQFEIFDRIYRDGAGTPRGTLVMIGDPKQAIFGFRGGDIAAYLRASAQVRKRYSLAVNYRSSTALVGALNALYEHTDDGGFNDPRIRYQPVQASGNADMTPYLIGDVPSAAPLSIHRFRGTAVNAKGEPLASLGELEKLALEDCAGRIVELLNDPTQTIGGHRVSPGDIAVLVATNVQLAALRRLLVAQRVPCVGSGRANVFDSDIARDLDLILYAVLNAEDERAVRGALSTQLLGATFADFIRWQDDVQAFERELERFADWRELVRSRGVLALIEALLACRGAWLLGASEGERAITDLRHLGELLADEQAQRHGLEGLYAWFSTMRRADADDGGSDAAQSRQLRIESDSRRVQLLTLHASKGLEFPIVFLPLVWRISSRDKLQAPNVLHFHDDAGHECVDLGSAHFAANRAHHFREDLQERLRLLYVAMTRAKHALHVYWVDRGKQADADEAAWQVAAIDELFQQALGRIGAAYGESGLDALAAQLAGVGVVEAWSGTPVDYGAPDESAVPRVAREPLPALRAFQWLHSFSGLVRQANVIAAQSPAADEGEPDPAVMADPDDVDAAPANAVEDPRLRDLYPLRGPRFGDAVHNVLECAKPGLVWPEQRALLAAQLTAQALRIGGEFATDPLELLGRLVDRVRDADLGDGVRLTELGDDERVAEFEFQFPLRRVSVAVLRSICAAHGFADVVPPTLNAVVLNGMLTGFSDLIFAHGGRYHVLDYKTNWLGAHLSDYADAALAAAIGEHHYDLQALLYTVALHRYLGQRMDGYTPERHLGESWYLFLRAVGLQPGLGIWRRQWPTALICALDEAFAGIREAAA
ncbi:MAG: UvrD-helicase domain-containing protein [Rudaea sp.]|nr:UvrD-helicase domain-containing protein [Rudaea sp.]